MDKTTAPQEPVKAEAEAPAEVIVTLEHPSFGSHTFRAPEAKVQGCIPEALHAAKHHAAVRAKVKTIDEQQNALVDHTKRVQARIHAAELLNDTAAKQREEREIERLQERSKALSAQRAKLLES